MQKIDVEIVLKKSSICKKSSIIDVAFSYLKKKKIKPGMVISNFDINEERILHYEAESIIIDDININVERIDETNINWHVYSLDYNGPQIDNMEDDEGVSINLANHTVLPSADYFKLWENLIYDSQIKTNLLQYITTMLKFSDKGVDPNIVTCNRVILLHGPPGTGKTSLCKALAQKISIRLQDRYRSTVLIEINSHSLFSKYFSESGKLVTKIFSKIKEIVDDPKTLACILIDEIESLAHARDQCMSGNEPSDSIRVVNAVLTQIDQIKSYPNLLIMATSNITGAIDIAFIDRADIKQYLGLPSHEAIYQIYFTCLQELANVGIIQSNDIQREIRTIESYLTSRDRIDAKADKLIHLSRESIGLSGRTLRKIPFLAHAMFVDRNTIDLDHFLDAMGKAVAYEKSQRNDLPAKKTCY